MDKVFDTIEKHISLYESMLDDCKKLKMDDPLMERGLVENTMLEIRMENYASAIASLIMLERELKGIVEY